MENEMKIVAWKQFTNENKQSTYKLQLEGSLSTKERKKILEELKGWTEVGYGWYKNGKEVLRLFTRSFQDKSSWIKWAKEFPYDLKELSKSGKTKKIN